MLGGMKDGGRMVVVGFRFVCQGIGEGEGDGGLDGLDGFGIGFFWFVELS